MAVRTNRYRPLLFSERVAGRDIDNDGILEFTLCRAAALAMGVDAATNGEWTKNPNGSSWGRAKIAKALERMRKGTGEPDRDGYNQSHMDNFLQGIGFPTIAYKRFNVKMSEIKEALSKGWVVFLAGTTQDTPANSPLRRYVNAVPHEIILTRINSDGSKIAFIDPMTPHGTAKYERWVDANDVYRFGAAFMYGENQMVAGRMKRGAYTEAAEVARDRAAVILKLQKNAILSTREISRLNGVIDDLQEQLDNCTGNPECEALVDELTTAINEARALLNAV